MERSWKTIHSPDLEAASEQLASLETRFRCRALSDHEQERVAKQLGGFELLRERAALLEAQQVEASSDAFTLCLLEIDYEVRVRPEEHTGARYQHLRTARAHTIGVAGLIELGAPIGRVAIRPETLGDKLADLFGGQEVDFDEHPDFSRRYYVQTQDEALLRRNVRGALLDALARRDDLHAEADGDRLLVELPGVVREGTNLLDEACGLFADLTRAA